MSKHKHGKGNRGPGNSGSSSQGQTPATTPVSIGHLPVGLRAQLTAALQLSSDCTLRDAKASDATIDLRGAGCLAPQGSDPATTTSSCSDQLRARYDDVLPQYATPRKNPQTTLNVVRFAPGTKVTCEQVRSAMF